MVLKKLAVIAVLSGLGVFVQAAPFIEMTTNKGVIVLELDAEKAPNTVGNFVQYVNDKHFENLIFHRVIKGFMVQGGGFDETMKQKATRTPVGIESNNGLKNTKGTIAMARTMDPNSATSQFFINTVDNAFLDHPGQDGHGYTVFGKVISGQEVVDQIEAVATGSKNGHEDVPLESVVITKMTLIEDPNAPKAEAVSDVPNAPAEAQVPAVSTPEKEKKSQ